MIEMTGTILNIAFTIFAVYGTYVLTKWKKAARDVTKLCEEMCEEMREEIHPTEKGGERE